MDLLLAFLHGETVFFALVFAALIALVGVPLLIYIWLRHTKVSPLQLTVAYLILMAVLSVLFGSVRSGSDSALALIAAMFGFLLSLPWAPLASWALTEARNSPVSDREFAVLMMLAAGINAVLLYFAAGKMRRLIQ